MNLIIFYYIHLGYHYVIILTLINKISNSTCDSVRSVYNLVQND